MRLTPASRLPIEWDLHELGPRPAAHPAPATARNPPPRRPPRLRPAPSRVPEKAA